MTSFMVESGSWSTKILSVTVKTLFVSMVQKNLKSILTIVFLKIKLIAIK